MILEQYYPCWFAFLIGLFFAISGANKLFVAGGIKPVYETLVKANVPLPHQTAYFVSGVEFVCGSLLAVGLFQQRGLRRFIDRHDCRHPDQRAFHTAAWPFAS